MSELRSKGEMARLLFHQPRGPAESRHAPVFGSKCYRSDRAIRPMNRSTTLIVRSVAPRLPFSRPIETFAGSDRTSISIPKLIGLRVHTDAQAGILLAEASSAICVQRFDGSRIVQITLRIAFRCVLHRCESQDIRC